MLANHAIHILQKAPKEKTLEYSVKEGWEPLCKFLGVPVPDVPFPHKNKGGKIHEEYKHTHPLSIRIGKEALVSAAVLVATVAYSSYNIATNSFEQSVLGLSGRLLNCIAFYCGYKPL